ncbi:MAG: TGS domain-containing protein, partial [Bacteroidota bacterium]|nr:TGS domain-containing protein [Bacteroidota bacterium]
KKTLHLVQNYIDSENKMIFDNTLTFIDDFYEKTKNKLGFTFFEESLDIALIVVSDIGLGFSALLSALLFRAFEAGKIDENFIEKEYPTNLANQIISILKGLIEVNKLDNEKVFGLKEVDFSQKQNQLSKRSKKFAQTENEYLEQQGEYFKHFYIVMGEDVRVILLKLANNLYQINKIKAFDSEKRTIVCREARFLYAPMAHQLGLYNIKTYLEEIAMKYLNSDTYQYIAKVLAETKKSRDKYIENFIKPIKNSLSKIGIEANIKGRPKSIHSIWNKMKNQKVDLDKIYDLFAIRIILLNKYQSKEEEKSDCWNVYSKITDHWTPNINRLKDWVSTPKASGYESLHTTVIGPEGKWVEVQIRTQRMDDIAEKGSAAHWKYKEIKGDSGHISVLETLRNIIENPEIIKKSDVVKSELYSDILFVYTPTGELKKLNNSATVLDFAYKVHSKIGDTCVGAKINNKLVGIRHKLTNGNVVNVRTSNIQKPKEEWIEIVVSNQARTKIRQSLKRQEKERVALGKQILNNCVETFKEKYNKPDFELDDKKITRLRKRLSQPKTNDFFIALSTSEVKVKTELLHELFVEPEELSYKSVLKKIKNQIVDDELVSSEKDNLIIDKNMSGIKYEYAKCCNPIPGDNIFAFVTASSGTKIHKLNCPNAPDLIAKYPYRIIKASWKKMATEDKFKAKLQIVSEQKPGVVAKI